VRSDRVTTVPEVPCERCGNHFDPDRETAASGASSARCPSCGWEYEPTTDVGTDGDATMTVASEGVTITLTIEVEPAG
jgi:rubredoxin